MRNTKAVLLIQIFHSFVSGILGVAIPLMMNARGINVVLIGFVFASMPLIMQFGRMLFATLSDFLGRKLFFISNGILGFISSLIYYFAYTPMDFLFGKISEGLKEGTLWAVNRPFLLENSHGRWRILVYLRTVVYVAFALGSLLAGFLAGWLLYEGTMLLCGLLGIFGVAVSLLLVERKKEKFSVKKALFFLDFRKKRKPSKFSLCFSLPLD